MKTTLRVLSYENLILIKNNNDNLITLLFLIDIHIFIISCELYKI